MLAGVAVWSVFFTLAMLLSIAATGAQAGTIARPLELGTLGGNESQGVAVSDNGQVVGVANRAPPAVAYFHAFSWTPAHGMVDLTASLTAAVDSHVIAVTTDGRVFGNFYDGAAYRAFTWKQATGATEIGTLSGWSDSLINAVSANGQAVGRSGNDGFSWTATSGLIGLGTLEGLQVTNPNAVSSAGHVVGYGVGFDEPDAARAFIWTEDDGLTELGPNALGCTALDVNDLGEVVGTCGRFSERRGFYWSIATGMIDIGALHWPRFINNAGQVAGWVTSETFYWTFAGGAVYLGALGGASSEPIGISETGTIAGHTLTQNGTFHSFVSSHGEPMMAVGVNPDEPSYPRKISAGGSVAGDAGPPSNMRGYYWSAATGAIELPTVAGGNWTQGMDASDGGHAVGTGGVPGGWSRAIRWSLLLDSDDDGVADDEDPDDDGDGLPDALEISLGLDPLSSADAALDLDGDGLANLTEFQIATRLDLADTDGDGVNDGAEHAMGRNPRVNESAIILLLFKDQPDDA